MDLDGTLLDNERRLVASSADAIRRATKRGIHVALASGRIHASMRPYALEMGLEGPFICSNGAHVLGCAGEEIEFHALHVHTRRIVIDFALDRRIHLNAYTRSELLYLHESPWLELYRSRVRSMVPRQTEIAEILEIELAKLLLVGEPAEIADLRLAMEPSLDPSLARITESEPEYLEVLNPLADKGHGLQVLAKSLGIEREETAAVGDYYNDVEMLRWAGFSGAMAGGVDEVKKAAEVILPSNEDGGVGCFIDSYVLNGQE